MNWKRDVVVFSSLEPQSGVVPRFRATVEVGQAVEGESLELDLGSNTSASRPNSRSTIASAIEVIGGDVDGVAEGRFIGIRSFRCRGSRHSLSGSLASDGERMTSGLNLVNRYLEFFPN